MKTYGFFVINFILVFCCLPSCVSSIIEPPPPGELKNLGETNHIEIRVDKKNAEGNWTPNFTKTIDDPEQIVLITKNLQKYSDGWETYMPYLPGRVTVLFYGKEDLIIPIIVASYSTTTGGLSYFRSRPAGPSRPMKESEFKELIGLLGIDEDLAYYSDQIISVK